MLFVRLAMLTCDSPWVTSFFIAHFLKKSREVDDDDDDELMLNVLRCHLTY